MLGTALKSPDQLGMEGARPSSGGNRGWAGTNRNPRNRQQGQPSPLYQAVWPMLLAAGGGMTSSRPVCPLSSPPSRGQLGCGYFFPQPTQMGSLGSKRWGLRAS